MKADFAWLVEVFQALALSALAAALAITAVDAADHADLRLALSGLPGRIWAILPVLAPISAAIAVSRWDRSGARVGWLASGWRGRRLVAGAAAAGFLASLVTLGGWELAPVPAASSGWLAYPVGEDQVWIGPGGRSATVDAGRLVGASVGAAAVRWSDDLAVAPAPSSPPGRWVAGPEAPVSALMTSERGAAREAWLAERVTGPAAVGAWAAIGAAVALSSGSWAGVLGGALLWRLADLSASSAVAQGRGGVSWLFVAPLLASLGALAAWARA